MSSPSTIITLGLGSFDSVNLLPTLGYGSATLSPTGHGKTAGVPRLDLARGAAHGIAKWLRDQQKKQRAAANEILARRQSLIERYVETAAAPLTIRLRSSVRVSATTSFSPSVTLAPPPIISPFTAMPTVFAHFAVDIHTPPIHNVDIAASVSVSAALHSVFVDIGKIRRRDEAMLAAILAKAMLED